MQVAPTKLSAVTHTRGWMKHLRPGFEDSSQGTAGRVPALQHQSIPFVFKLPKVISVACSWRTLWAQTHCRWVGTDRIDRSKNVFIVCFPEVLRGHLSVFSQALAKSTPFYAPCRVSRYYLCLRESRIAGGKVAFGSWGQRQTWAVLSPISIGEPLPRLLSGDCFR